MTDFNENNLPNQGNNGEPTSNTEPTPNPEPEKKYTDADVDRIMKEKKAKWQKQKDEELAEAQRIAKMDAQEKAEHERDKLKKELDELKATNTRNALKDVARSELSQAGINVSDELIASCIGADEEATVANAKNLAQAFSNAVDSAVKDRIGGGTPPKGNNGGSPKLTKEEILNIKNPELRQKAMLENRHLFNF